MTQVSVIIPNFNRADALKLTLSALAEQELKPDAYEVIIIDDGSTDESLEIVETAQVPFTLRLLRQANRGAGAARNRGVQQAQADFLVFLDSDMIASPDLLRQYLAAGAAHPEALLIGRQNPWTAAYQTFFDEVMRYEWFRDLGPDPFQPSFYHVLSSNMALRRAQFESVGGFDEGVGTGAHPATDDTDFGYRAYKIGLGLVYWPEALAYHNHPRTLDQRCAQEHSIAMWTARMFTRYPEMRALIPAFEEIQPVSWQQDPPALIGRKLARQLLALKPALGTLVLLAQSAELWWPNPSLLRFLYWKIISGYRVTGFRKGHE
jgi:glycosyltransferase involved in cell wall biosynthesis